MKSTIKSRVFFFTEIKSDKYFDLVINRCAWNYFFTRESGCYHSTDCLFDSGLYWQIHVNMFYQNILL